MRYFIYIFYSYFLLVGGFRNYSSELFLQQECGSLYISQAEFIFMSIGENAIFALSLCLLIFPLSKYLHALFFLIIFCLNFYFQNFINYEKYIVFIDFVPLFFSLYLHFKNNAKKLNHFKIIITRIIAIGFLTAVAGKVYSGWLNPEVPVIHSLVFFLTNIIVEPHFFHQLFFKINHLFIYKILDYTILLFQLSAIIIFIKPGYFKIYAKLCIVFHLGIMILLHISLFFPYIIAYTLILMNDDKIEPSSIFERGLATIFCALILTFYIFNQFDVLFLPRLLNYNLYIHLSDIYTILSIVVFYFFAIYPNNKRAIFTTFKIPSK